MISLRVSHISAGLLKSPRHRKADKKSKDADKVTIGKLIDL